MPIRLVSPALAAGLLCGLLLLPFAAFSQPLTQSPLLRTFNETRNEIHAKSMLVLGLWSLANFTAAALQYPASDGRSRYFHEISTFWSAANLGRAALGYWRARTAGTVLSPAETQRAQRRTVRWQWVNLGIDALAIAGGAYLISRGNDATATGERLQGYGTGMVLQGGFQLAFDGLVLLLHHTHGRRLKTILQSFSVSPRGLHLALRF